MKITSLGRRAILLSAIASVSFAGSANAANLYWEGNDLTMGGDGIWDNAITQSWNTLSDGTGSYVVWTNANSDTANFGDTGGNVTVSGGVVANSMFFSADGYVLSGGSITLGGGAVNVQGANTATITSSVVGTTLQKNASGTLVLSSASGAGTINVNNGTLVGNATNAIANVINVNNGAVFSSTAAGAINGTAGTITLDNGSANPTATLWYLNGNTQTVNRVNLTAAKIDLGGGTLTIGNSISVGTTTVAAGVAVIDNGTLDFGSAAKTIITLGSPLVDTDLDIGATIKHVNTINKEGTGWLGILNDNPLETGSFSINAGRIVLKGNGQLNNVSQTLVRDLTILELRNNATDGTLSTRLSDTGTLAINGGSILLSGGVTENVGQLNIGSGLAQVALAPGASGLTKLSATGLGSTNWGSQIQFRTTSGTIGGATAQVSIGGFGAGTTQLNGGGYVLTSTGPEIAVYDSTIGTGGSVRAITSSEYVVNTDTPNENLRIDAVSVGAGTIAFPAGNHTYRSLTLVPSGTSSTTFAAANLGTGTLTLTDGQIIKTGTTIGQFPVQATRIDSPSNEIFLYANTGSLVIGGGTGGSSVIQNYNASAVNTNITKAGAGTAYFIGTPTATGTLTINGGYVYISGSNLNTISGYVINSGTIVTANAEKFKDTGPIFLNGSGTNVSVLSLINFGTAVETIGALTMQGGGRVQGGTLILNGTVTRDTIGTGTALISNATINLGTSRTFTINDNLASPVDMSITGSMFGGSLSKGGAGVLRLAGTSSAWTGVTTISAGTLLAGAANVIPDTSGVNISAATANLDLGGFTEGIGTLAVTGKVLNGNVALGGDFTMANGGQILADLSLGASRIATITGTGTIGGAVSGAAFGIDKQGTGKLVLTNAANTYNGGTTISTGTLEIGTGAQITSNVTVAAAGALGGNGTTTGTVSVSGKLAPGASVGKLHTGSETWNADATYDFEITNATGAAGVGYDTIALDQGSTFVDMTSTTGNPFTVFVKGTAANFDKTQDYTWILADATSDLRLNGISVTDISQFDPSIFAVNTTGFTNDISGAAGFNVNLDLTNKNVVLNFNSAVPEPTTGIMLLGAMAGLLGGRRRKVAVN